MIRAAHGGCAEWNGGGTRIEDDQQGIVGFRVAVRGEVFAGVARHQHPEAAGLGLVPMVIAHGSAAGTDPENIPQLGGLGCFKPVQKPGTA